MTMMSQVKWARKLTPVPQSGTRLIETFRVIDSPFALLPASHSFTKEELAWFISDEEAALFWEGCPNETT